MNVFFVIILVAVLVEFLLGVVSNLLNLSALRPEAPEGLEDVYEPEKYAKSQEYTKVNTGFDLITGTFKLAVLLTFWLFERLQLARPDRARLGIPRDPERRRVHRAAGDCLHSD